MSKLVRDKIPLSYPDSKFYIADNREFGERLLDKLQEEVNEFYKDFNIEELADITEVLNTIMKYKGWTQEQLKQAVEQKARNKGSFEKRIIRDTE